MEQRNDQGADTDSHPGKIMICTLHDFAEGVGVRPPCPICRADDPASNGLRWMCRSCGKQWVKYPVSRK